MTANADTKADPRADTDTKTGLTIGEIDGEEFRLFARRFATSPEIGPIGTCLDSDAEPVPEAELHIVALKGCETICAAAAFQLFRSKHNSGAHVLKLDSIIVDPRLRRRGLGAVLVADSFSNFVKNSTKRVSRIYAHSVHPATVAMLTRLGFSAPPPVGAPITDASIDDETREAFLDACDSQTRGLLSQMRLQCEFCRKGDRRARPWCHLR